MRESYTEGVATHGGREPCVDDPQGRGEASVAVRAGWAIEPRNGQFGVLTLLAPILATANPTPLCVSVGRVSRTRTGAAARPTRARSLPGCRLGAAPVSRCGVSGGRRSCLPG